MPKALAVALLLSACLPAAARGFFFTSLDASREPDSTWWATANSCLFQSDTSAALRLKAGIRLDSLLHFALDHETNPIHALRTPPKGVLRTLSNDKKLVAYSFAVPLSGGKYAFFGQVHASKGKRTFLTRFKAVSDWDSYFEGTEDQWPGGLIYAINGVTYKGTTRYMALMYDPDVSGVQKKWVEPWIIGRVKSKEWSRNLPAFRFYFGAGVFSISDFNGEHFIRPPQRLIMRYSSKVSASIRCGKTSSEILIDEVAPMRNASQWEHAAFGPTLTVDRLVFEQGKWILAPRKK